MDMSFILFIATGILSYALAAGLFHTVACTANGPCRSIRRMSAHPMCLAMKMNRTLKKTDRDRGLLQYDM